MAEATALAAPTNDGGNQNIEETRGLGGASLARRTTAALVQAEKASALVQARIMQAVARPRDFFVVRERILKACTRPRFAETARYAKPTGKKDGVQQYAVGLTIGFATEAARLMGNLTIEPQIVYEDARTRTISVVALDLESNFSTSEEFTLEKTVERRQLKAGQKEIAVRINSYGDQVYIVEAGEEEFNVKAAAKLSKAWRNVVLKMVPSDLKEEAMEEIERTLALIDAAEKAGKPLIDPTAKRKKLVDWYRTTLAVSAVELADYLGHSIDTATSEEMRHLQDLGETIVDPDANLTWKQALAAHKATPESADANGVVGEEKPSAAAAKVKEALEAKAKAKAEAKAAKAAADAKPAAPATAAQPAKKDEPAPAQQAPAKPSVAPSAGLEDASAIIDAIEAATETAELDVAEKRLVSHVEAGEIGTTHHARVRAALASARQRLGAGK